MYKRYVESVKQRPTHERRQHALQMAGAIMIAVFVVWVATIGIRLATVDPLTAEGGDSAADLANVATGAGNATLLVSTSTDDYFSQ